MHNYRGACLDMLVPCMHVCKFSDACVMHMCINVCIGKCICTASIHKHICTHVCICTCNCASKSAHGYISTCILVPMYVSMCGYSHACMSMCTCMGMHTWIYLNMQQCIHACLHTYIHQCMHVYVPMHACIMCMYIHAS